MTAPPSEVSAAVVSRRPPRAALRALAFGSGFAVMVLELAGARIMAPVFGLSAVPWTAVIGVVLAALAWGSHLGGRWADEGRVPLSAILLAASVTAALPLVAAPLPGFALTRIGFIPGALLSALVMSFARRISRHRK